MTETMKLTAEELDAAYDEVARFLNYVKGGEFVADVLDDCAEEANENGLEPFEKKREMLRTLEEIRGDHARPIAERAARILTLGYDDAQEGR